MAYDTKPVASKVSKIQFCEDFWKHVGGYWEYLL